MENMEQQYALRIDSIVDEEQIIKALSGETKPKVIIIGQADVGRMGASKIATLLKDMKVPLIVGDVSDVSDQEILKIIEGLPDTQLGVGTDLSRNMAALQKTPVMKIENVMRDVEPFILEDPKERKQFKDNNKHRRNHFNRNQRFKGRK